MKIQYWALALLAGSECTMDLAPLQCKHKVYPLVNIKYQCIVFQNKHHTHWLTDAKITCLCCKNETGREVWP